MRLGDFHRNIKIELCEFPNGIGDLQSPVKLQEMKMRDPFSFSKNGS